MTFLSCIALALSAAGSRAAGCDGSEHRQFDFWLGYWEVYTPDDKLVGHNLITQAFDGCAIHEQYRTPSGFNGGSYSAYDATRDNWTQTWTDNSGLVLQLRGGFDNQQMILSGETTGADGSVTQHRVTWSMTENGDVRQRWDSKKATDDWTTVFDGRYRRPATSDVKRLTSLHWLAGTWRFATEEKQQTERWYWAGPSMLRGRGETRYLNNSRPDFAESLSLVETGDSVVYLADVPGNPRPVPFKLTDVSAKHAVFRNVDYDFPKQLVYTLSNNCQLDIAVSDLAERGFTLSLTRASPVCASTAER